MEKKQYTITEDNDWEGELFGYIMYLTPEEAEKIKKKAQEIFDGEETVTIEETEYTAEDVKKINNASSNSYMDRLGFYEFASETVLDDWKEHGSLFYKGNGLNEI
jgi:hypothetical protein